MLKDKPKVIPSHEVVFDSPYFKVKKNKHFLYGERLGVNSIAFILVSKHAQDPRPYGVVKEYKDPIEQFMITAFGGSIDDPKYREDLELLVQDEVIEESGFNVGRDDIFYLDRVLASTQMNQFVHLFVVYVDKALQGEKTTTNPTEQMAEVVWCDSGEIAQLEDWKAVTILSKKVYKGL